tara:strand:- start:465 stop:1253 length:789 start_codon:yes stop_codon:yes gene_type:complete
MGYKKNLSYKAFLKSKFKSIKHSTYFDVYDELFTKYRNKKITFVEIGVLSGGSLFMWRNFFGPKARIIGIDLNPQAKKWAKHGFEIYIGDQSDINFWKKFKKKVGLIDIILDDGGHRYIDQITSIECMLDNIKDNGIIVVEDTHTSYMNHFGNKKYSFISYIKNKIDKINQRSHRLNGKNPEMKIWSIKIYESIVAIFINNRGKFEKSFQIKNKGKDDKAIDFRVKKNKFNSNSNILKWILNKLNIYRLENKTNSIIKNYFK